MHEANPFNEANVLSDDEDSRIYKSAWKPEGRTSNKEHVVATRFGSRRNVRPTAN